MEDIKVACGHTGSPVAADPRAHFCTRLACMSCRRLVDYRPLLLVVTLWECWHFFSPHRSLPLHHTRGLHQHTTGVPHHDFLAEFVKTYRTRIDSVRVHVATSFPAVLYAVADSHTPAGPQLQHRLPMFFKDSPHVTFLLHDWYTDTSWSYILCCCATLLLAVISVLLKGFRRKLENLLQRNECTDLPPRDREHQQHTERAMVTRRTAAHGAAHTETHAVWAQAAATAPAPPITAGEAALTAHSAKEGVISFAARRVRTVEEGLEDSSEKHSREEDAHRLEWVGQGHPEDDPCSENVEYALQNNAIQAVDRSQERVRPPISLGHAADVQVLPHGGPNGTSSRGEHHHCSNTDNGKHIFMKKAKSAGSWILAAMHGFPVGSNAVRALAAFCNYSVDYVLMLLAMTFNVGIVLSLFAGIALGFLLIGHQLLPPALESQFHSLESSSHSQNSGCDARGCVTKNLPSKCSRNLDTDSPTTKTSWSTALDAESHKHGLKESTDSDQFAAKKTNSGGTPKRHLAATPEDVYCCTYTGAGKEEALGDQQIKEEDFCLDPEDAELSSEKQRLRQGASIDNYTVASFEWGSVPTSAVNTAYVLATPAPSRLYDAATHDDGTPHGAGLSIYPAAPSGKEVTAERGSFREATAGAAQGGKPPSYLSGGTDFLRNPGTSEGSRGSHEERRGSSVSRSNSLGLSPPLHGDAEKVAPTLAPSRGWRRNQQEDTYQGQQQHWPHPVQGVETEFQRRPSDCYDVLVVAEDMARI